MPAIDPWFLDNLVCPRDKQSLHLAQDALICPQNHVYPVVDGIPVMVLEDVRQTHQYATQSLLHAQRHTVQLYDSLAPTSAVDPFVQDEIVATNGNMFHMLKGKLAEYPIPHICLPPGNGQLLLDVGCNWGRWSISAFRRGYIPVGIDPSLEAIAAATRVARQLGIHARFVVGDSRFLPFKDSLFDVVFSYSVLQHFDKHDVIASLQEVHRVLKLQSTSQIQMLNFHGVRCLYHQARRGFREPQNFEVRYWHPLDLVSTFSRFIGPSELTVDGFFSANAQLSDTKFLPIRFKAIVMLSNLLRSVSEKAPFLRHAADSLFVTSHKTEHMPVPAEKR
jgi:SAM-dependent methyltransferase